MKRLISIFIFSTLMVVVKAQQPKGLYFENLDGTKWMCETIHTDSSFFKSEHYGLALIKGRNDSIKDISCIWIFGAKKVVLTSKGDAILRLDYKIDKDENSITFKNKVDSITFDFTSISTGSYVGFYVNNIIEIVGEAQNSKDGAILISSGSIYRINKKREWKESYLGHTVKVKAQIIRDEYLTKSDLGYDNGAIKQGRLASCQITGTTNLIADYPNRKIKIFPNPTPDYLMLPCDIERLNIWVYNSTGQLIELKLDGNILDLTEQPSGMYYIKIDTEGWSNIYKVMKF